jgi:hypothetical protein
LALPPPHAPFAPGSSYLLDVLVPVPLPFFFLFPLPFFFSCCWFFSLLWSSESRCFRSPPSVQVICASPPRLSPIATFLSSAFGQILSEPLRLIVWRFISLFLLCFPLFFVFVCSPYFLVLVFPYIFLSLFVLCVLFLQFCRSPLRYFCRPPPTVGLYSAPPTTNFKWTCQWLRSA